MTGRQTRRDYIQSTLDKCISMIDTVMLHLSLKYPLAPEIKDRFAPLKWNPRKHVFNPPPVKGHALPRLTLSQYHDRSTGLSAEVSIPEMLFGNNFQRVTDANMPHAYDMFDRAVHEMTGLDFDARNRNALRIDYPANFHVGNENMSRYLSVALQATMKQMEKWMYDGTVYFGSKSKSPKTFNNKRRRPRLIKIYDKHKATIDEVREGRATNADVEATHGLLRIETGFSTGQSLQQLANKFDCKDRTAESLLTERVSYAVSTVTIDALGLSMPILNVDTRVDKLIAAYPKGRECKNLISFMGLLDRFGQDFWEHGICGYNERSYDRDARRLKDAGVWLSTDVPHGLPALQLVESSQQGAFMAQAA